MSAPANIAIIGAGLMGHGIAQVFALKGHQVRVFDTAPAALAALRERVRQNLAELGQDVQAAERVHPEPLLARAVADAQVVFEAGPENLKIKQQLFADIERAAPRTALLSSNT